MSESPHERLAEEEKLATRLLIGCCFIFGLAFGQMVAAWIVAPVSLCLMILFTIVGMIAYLYAVRQQTMSVGRGVGATPKFRAGDRVRILPTLDKVFWPHSETEAVVVSICIWLKSPEVSYEIIVPNTEGTEGGAKIGLIPDQHLELVQ